MTGNSKVAITIYYMGIILFYSYYLFVCLPPVALMCNARLDVSLFLLPLLPCMFFSLACHLLPTSEWPKSNAQFDKGAEYWPHQLDRKFVSLHVVSGRRSVAT